MTVFISKLKYVYLIHENQVGEIGIIHNMDETEIKKWLEELLNINV